MIKCSQCRVKWGHSEGEDQASSVVEDSRPLQGNFAPCLHMAEVQKCLLNKYIGSPALLISISWAASDVTAPDPGQAAGQQAQHLCCRHSQWQPGQDQKR